MIWRRQSPLAVHNPTVRMLTTRTPVQKGLSLTTLTQTTLDQTTLDQTTLDQTKLDQTMLNQKALFLRTASQMTPRHR